MTARTPLAIVAGLIEQIQSADMADSLSALLDWLGSAAQGDILYRGSSSWAYLAPGTSGQLLQTNGASANPTWVSPSATTFPPGIVIPYGGISAPSGYLMCDGSSVLRASYADLYDIICPSKGTFTVTIATPGVVTLTSHGMQTGDRVELTTDGSLPTGLTAYTNYYVIYIDANSFNLATSYANAIASTAIDTSGTQSGTHTLRYIPNGTADSTHFNVPDMVGAAPRGAGTSTGYTQDVSVVMGHKDDDQFQDAQIGVTVSGTTYYGYSDAQNYANSVSASSNFAPLYANSTKQGVSGKLGHLSDGTNGTPRTGNETKMKNVGLNFIIKT